GVTDSPIVHLGSMRKAASLVRNAPTVAALLDATPHLSDATVSSIASILPMNLDANRAAAGQGHVVAVRLDLLSNRRLRHPAMKHQIKAHPAGTASHPRLTCRTTTVLI
ncbi:unnamed protein product, partial [Nesidiocoris tenuis]